MYIHTGLQAVLSVLKCVYSHWLADCVECIEVCMFTLVHIQAVLSVLKCVLLYDYIHTGLQAVLSVFKCVPISTLVYRLC